MNVPTASSAGVMIFMTDKGAPRAVAIATGSRSIQSVKYGQRITFNMTKRRAEITYTTSLHRKDMTMV